MTVWRSVQVFALIAAALLIHQPVVALDVNWIRAPDDPGDWGEETNWDVIGGPIAEDIVFINNMGIVQITDEREISGLQVGRSGSNEGTLEILSGGSLTMINGGLMSIGRFDSAVGVLHVNGGSFTSAISNDNVGQGGTGTVRVTAGTFTHGPGGIFYGLGGGHGMLEVSGTGTYTGGAMELGEQASVATISLTGDSATIATLTNIDSNVGGTVTFNLTPGPTGINPIGTVGITGGNLFLNGSNDTLNVDLSDYTAGSSALTLFTYTNTRTGEFETVNISGGDGTLVYDDELKVVRLEFESAGLAGDYNSDNVVDAADYAEWRDNLGDSTALPNDGGLGTPIGSAHFDLWSAEYGNATAAVAASSTQAPEPTACLLISVALAIGGRSASSRGK
jgi:hypothetical protein